MSDLITSDVWVAIVAACTDIGLGLVFHYLHRHSQRHIRQIQEAETFSSVTDIKKKITENGIAYGCVQGDALKMEYQEAKHLNIRNNPIVNRETLTEDEIIGEEIAKKIFEKMMTPSLSIKVEKRDIKISEPGKAWMIWDKPIYIFSLNQITNVAGIIKDMTDTMFRYVKSLILKSDSVIVIGRIRLEMDRVQLEPPDEGYLFVIGNMSKEEVIKRFQSSSSKWWRLRYVFPMVGAGCLLYVGFKIFKNYRIKADDRQKTDRR